MIQEMVGASLGLIELYAAFSVRPALSLSDCRLRLRNCFSARKIAFLAQLRLAQQLLFVTVVT
jgi:hypothetical protein